MTWLTVPILTCLVHLSATRRGEKRLLKEEQVCGTSSYTHLSTEMRQSDGDVGPRTRW